MQNNDVISRRALVEDLSYCAPELFFDKDFLLHKIMRQPAIDAAPVVHAHWIEYYTDIMCSHCHATYKDEIVDMYQDGVDHRRYDGLEYCPHCGSIMDGGDDDA